MKAYVIFFLLISSFGYSQNLVLNPSFEDTITTNYSQFYPVCRDWYNANGGSVDYFTPFWEELCCNLGNIENSPQSANFGFQVAQEGSSYVGLIIFQSEAETKEFIRGRLSQPLEAQTLYCVGIWLNLSDSTGLKSCDFQVAFSNEELINSLNAGSMNLTNTVEFDVSNIDTSMWTYFEQSYLAYGGEQYIYLGSNTPNENIDCIEEFNPSSQFGGTAYILCDNVSVIPTSSCSLSNIENTGYSSLTIHPNPFHHFIRLKFDFQNEREIVISNSAGQKVFTLRSIEKEIEIPTSRFSSGCYTVIVNEEEKITHHHVIKF